MVLVEEEPGTRGSGWNGLGLEWALPFNPDDKYCTEYHASTSIYTRV